MTGFLEFMLTEHKLNFPEVSEFAKKKKIDLNNSYE